MTQQTYVFDAELVGFEGVRRKITVRGDLTLVDLHYALQSAFGWDDDHLFSFWLDGEFWGSEDEHYTHPRHARSSRPRRRSACARLEELALEPGRRLAYVFDYAAEWRVALALAEVRPGGGRAVARCIERVGAAPPQYPRPVPATEADGGQATIEFVALMVEEADAA